MPHQLVYVSKATEPMPKSKLYKILVVARGNNSRLDVTGLLVFVEGLFFQILEGDRAVVTNLMNKIASDKRHADVRIIHEVDTEQRTFPAWRMAYVAPNAQDFATWSGLRNTTSLEETLTFLKSNPNRVPEITLKLLEMIRQGEPDLSGAE